MMLIGPKGSGKTYIGTVVAANTDIKFLRVEPLWLSLQPAEDGWTKVEIKIDNLLTSYDTVMIESLGGSEGFERLRTNLANKYTIYYIRVWANLDICLERVKNRDSSDHIAVSDSQVLQYNALASQVELDWTAEIINYPPATTENILQTIISIQRNNI